MIISKDNIKNKYVLAYCKAHGVKQGEEVKISIICFGLTKNTMILESCIICPNI